MALGIVKMIDWIPKREEWVKTLNMFTFFFEPKDDLLLLLNDVAICASAMDAIFLNFLKLKI
jgi:hypothetical protein